MWARAGLLGALQKRLEYCHLPHSSCLKLLATLLNNYFTNISMPFWKKGNLEVWLQDPHALVQPRILAQMSRPSCSFPFWLPPRGPAPSCDSVSAPSKVWRNSVGFVQGFQNLSWKLFLRWKPSPFSLLCFRFSGSWVYFIWSSLILRADSFYVLHLFFWQAFLDHLLHVSCCSVPYQHFRFSRFLDKFITIL